jgi:hypothetical protein
MAPGMSLISVNAIIILSTEDGSRVFAKYYKEPHQTATSMSCYILFLIPSSLQFLAFHAPPLDKTVEWRKYEKGSMGREREQKMADMCTG